jgi:mevalonate kinase
VDHATVLQGGILRLSPRAGRELEISPLDASPRAVAALRVFDTGPPAESTGQVVAAVRARRETDREAFGAILLRMEMATRSLEEVLRTGAGLGAMVAPVREYERQLEAIGVVPDRVVAMIRRLEALGAAAKISGAGSLSGNGAGAMIVCRSRAPEQLARQVPGLRLLEAGIGAPGFRVEERQ